MKSLSLKTLKVLSDFIISEKTFGWSQTGRSHAGSRSMDLVYFEVSINVHHISGNYPSMKHHILHFYDFGGSPAIKIPRLKCGYKNNKINNNKTP